MEQRCNKYSLNGDVFLAPLSLFPDHPVPDCLLCGRIQTSCTAAAQCVPFWLEFKEQLQTNKYYYNRINQHLSPQMLSPGNKNDLSKTLSCLSPSVFFGA